MSTLFSLTYPTKFFVFKFVIMFSTKENQMYDEYQVNSCFLASDTNTAHTLFHPTNPFINEICSDIYADSNFQRYNHENDTIDVMTIKEPRDACTDLSSAMVSEILRDFAVYNTYIPKEGLSDSNRHLSKKRSINNNQRSQSNSVQSLFSRTYHTRYVSCGGEDIYEVPTTSRTSTKLKRRNKHESKVTFKADVNNKEVSKQNVDKTCNNYAEKSTNCRPIVNLHSEDLLRRTMEKNLRLQNILKQLLGVRKREKQNEAWHNYINELKNKHGYVSGEPSYIETQYVPDQCGEVDLNDEYVDTNFKCDQSIPCQNLLKDFYSAQDAKQTNYEDYRYFENDNYDHCDSPAEYASNNVYRNNFYCYPTASQGRLMMLNREKAKYNLQKEWHRPLSNNYSGLRFVVADREIRRPHNIKARGCEGTESVSKATILKYNYIPSDNYPRFKTTNATPNKEFKKNYNLINKKNPRDIYDSKQVKNDSYTDDRYNQRLINIPVEDSHKYKYHLSESKTINHGVSEAHNQNQSYNSCYRKTNRACAVTHDYNVADSLNNSAHVLDYHKPVEAVKFGHETNKNSQPFQVIDSKISREIIIDQEINEDEEKYHFGNSISNFVYSNQEMREFHEPDAERTNHFCATSQDVIMKLIDSNERNYQVSKHDVGINNVTMINNDFEAIVEKNTQLGKTSSIGKISRAINISNYHCNNSQGRNSKEMDKTNTERLKLLKENIKMKPSCNFSQYIRIKEKNIQVDVPTTSYVQTDLSVNVLPLLEDETSLNDQMSGKNESIKDKYNRISNDVSTLRQKIKNAQNYAKYDSLSNIESKIDDLMNSINSFIMEIKSKKTMIPINKCTSVNFKYKTPSDNSKTFGFFNPEKIVCGIVTSSSGNTLENLHFGDQRLYNKHAGVSREIFDDIDRNNQITRDIEDEYTSKQSRGCAVQISIDIPTKDQSTAVSRSKVCVTDDKKGSDVSEEVLTTTVLDENKQMTIAVNTEPLGLFALLRVSSEAVKRILSYMPSIDYQSYLPVAQSARDARSGVARYICNICGASFGRPSQLSDHIQNHNKFTSTKDCCVCRHALDMSRRRLSGLFACQYCGLHFTRAYCCELHQQTCAKQSGRVHDVSSSLMLLR